MRDAHRQLDAHRPWRHVKVTEHRAACDFAFCMRDLADIHYPNADLIRVVMDNLSTHNPGALYETFPAPEAYRILQRPNAAFPALVGRDRNLPALLHQHDPPLPVLAPRNAGDQFDVLGFPPQPS